MIERKQIFYNLLKNSISAYFAAIEIHNKPNISYRYETVTLLMMNAWELILKAYIKKFILKRSIFETPTTTIKFDKALSYVSEHINSTKPKSFVAIAKNLEAIECYRNNFAHYFLKQIDELLFYLTARCALNFIEFLKEHFNKDILTKSGLFIMPLGFKLPFNPIDFLSKNTALYESSPEAMKFIEYTVKIIEDLNAEGINDSIILGFNLYLKNANKIQNSDIIAGLTSNKEEATIVLSKTRNIKLSNDPSAEIVNLKDDEFLKIYKHTHSDVVDWCKKNIANFKHGNYFNLIKKYISDKFDCIHISYSNPLKKTSPTKFYSDEALNIIKQYYENNLLNEFYSD
jgi:hypothetical protein